MCKFASEFPTLSIVMDRKSSLLANVLELDVSDQIDFLKCYFAEKHFSVLLRTESLTFQTEITAVLVNNAKFVQAKGKTRDESERLAVKKAWERVCSKGKDGELAGIEKKLGGCVGKFSPFTVSSPGLNDSVMTGKAFVHSPRRRRDIASAPMSPSEARDTVTKTVDSIRSSDQLDSLISAAAKAVEITKTPPSPFPRRQNSLKPAIRKSYPTETALRSLFNPKITKFQPPSPKFTKKTDLKEENFPLKSVMEGEELIRRAKRFQYRSLADARFEMKMKRVSLSIIGGSRDGEDTEK